MAPLLASVSVPVIAYVVLWSLALMLPLFSIALAPSSTRKHARPTHSGTPWASKGGSVQRRWT